MTPATAIRSTGFKNLVQPKLKALGENLLDQFALLAGGILLFVGTVDVVGAFGDAQNLDIADPIFKIPFRHLMLAFGLAQLVVSFVLLLIGKKILGIAMAALISASFLVYRAELWREGWRVSSGFMTRPLGLSLPATDLALSFLAAFLLLGGCGVLLAERRRRRRSESLKISCPSCGVHIRFAIADLGRNITCPECQASTTLRKPEETLKMSCYFCQGHIEFPPHALGEKLKCPHCHMDITLKVST